MIIITMPSSVAALGAMGPTPARSRCLCTIRLRVCTTSSASAAPVDGVYAFI
jgi:hypothetical protein